MKIQTQIFLLTLSNGEKAVPPKDPLVRLEQLKSHSTKLMEDFFSSCSGYYLIFSPGVGIVENLAGTQYLSVPKDFLWLEPGTHRRWAIVTHDWYDNKMTISENFNFLQMKNNLFKAMVVKTDRKIVKICAI